MKDYSQHGEQQVILDYFGSYKGNVLDIGANDGVTFSNSFALIKKGWAGTLLEPCKKTYEQLIRNHKGNPVEIYHLAIGNTTGPQDFYESGSLINGHDHSLVSTMIPEQMDRWKVALKPEHHVVEYVKTKILAVTWADFFTKCINRKFDFITIDVEGMELDILKQMDLKALKCKMICVEHNGKPQDFRAIIPDYMVTWYANKTNLIFAV